MFGRKVKQRANPGRLAMKEGKLVVNLCVDKTGKVIFTECDKALSTIKDPNLISMAEDCAERYVFEADNYADERQCGKLTFIFKIDAFGIQSDLASEF